MMPMDPRGGCLHVRAAHPVTAAVVAVSLRKRPDFMRKTPPRRRPLHLPHPPRLHPRPGETPWPSCGKHKPHCASAHGTAGRTASLSVTHAPMRSGVQAVEAERRLQVPVIHIVIRAAPEALPTQRTADCEAINPVPIPVIELVLDPASAVDGVGSVEWLAATRTRLQLRWLRAKASVKAESMLQE